MNESQLWHFFSGAEFNRWQMLCCTAFNLGIDSRRMSRKSRSKSAARIAAISAGTSS
jgi:hypothetical protein